MNPEENKDDVRIKLLDDKLVEANQQKSLLNGILTQDTDQGNYTEWWKYYGNGELEEKLTYKYNGDGVLLETVGIESDSSSSPNMTFRFENLDKEGNWLKSTHWKGKEPKTILERTIEYYP